VTAPLEILGGVGRDQVEQIERTLEAWNRGDLDAMLVEIHPDAEWAVAEENPDARLLHGIDEIRAYLVDWRETIHGLHYDVAEHLDAGDAVVTLGTMLGRAGADGPQLSVTLAFVTRFDGTVAVRTEEYLDAARALEAAGIER
jgi:ketosteroid isomerase-like protein